MTMKLIVEIIKEYHSQLHVKFYPSYF